MIFLISRDSRDLWKHEYLRQYVMKQMPSVQVRILCCEASNRFFDQREDVIYLFDGYEEFVKFHENSSTQELVRSHGSQSAMVPSALYKGDRRYFFGLTSEEELALEQVYLVEQARRWLEELKPQFVFMMGGGNLSRNAIYFVGEKLGIRCYRILNTNYLNPNREGVRYWFSANNFCRLSRNEKDKFGYSEEDLLKHTREFITSIEKTTYQLDQQARRVARKRRVSLDRASILRDLENILPIRKVSLNKRRQSWHRLKSLKNHILNGRLATDPGRIPKPFFLFPLNVPEDAQLVLRAPHFRDLLSVCEQIANVLPYGHTLAVKEHPGHVGMIDHYRLKASLKYHRNMVFVRGEEKLWDLLKETSALVTVNSTAAIEASVRNIPVVVVGEAFYKGTGLSYDVEYGLQLPEVLSEVIHDPKRCERQEALVSTICKILDETVPKPGLAVTPEKYLEVIGEGIIAKLKRED